MSATVGPVAAALIGGGGAVVGGVLTAGSNMAVELVRSRRENAENDAERNHELRRAARLVSTELAFNRVVLNEAVLADEWSQPDNFKTERWETYAPILSGHLPDEAWNAVDFAYTIFSRMKEIELAREEDDTEAAAALVNEVQLGIGALRPFTQHSE